VTKSTTLSTGTLVDIAATAGAASFVPLVLTRLDLVSFDADMTVRTFAVLLAAAVVVGIGVGHAVAGSSGLRILSALTGALLLGLVEIGSPGWVTVAVALGVTGTTAMIVAGVGALDRAATTLGAGVSLAAGSIAIGAAIGLAHSAWSPTADWAISTAVSGAICLAAGVIGVSQRVTTAPGGALDQRRRRREISFRHDTTTTTIPVSTAVRRPLRLLGLLLGTWPMMTSQIQADSAVGTRYPHLAVLLGAAIGFAVGAIGHLLDERRSDSTSRQVQALHVSTALAGVAAVTGVISHTLIGAVVGWGVALGAVVSGWVFAALTVSADPEPATRSVAVMRSAAVTMTGVVLGLLATAIAEPDHHTWWLTSIGIIVAHQAIRPLRRLVVEDAAGAAERRTGQVVARRSAQTLLDVTRLDSGYGQLQVLFGVDVAIERGEVIALIGANGAGKTTLLRTIAGLHPLWSGRVQFGGVDLAGLDAAARVGAGLMLVSPESAIARHLSVDDNLRMFSHLLPIGEARAARRRVYEAFPRLQERLRQTASTLSGGERQMLALSRALVLRPQLLLLDEVTLGLSPQAVAELGPSIRRLGEEGTALVIVEQSTSVALSLADRAVVMERGVLVADFPADRLRARPDLVRQIHLEGIDEIIASGVLS